MFLLLIILFLITGCASTPIPKPTIKAQSYSSTKTFSRTTPAKTKGIYYTVKKGDTLWSIAKKFNITVAKLTARNRIKETKPIEKGQILRIPQAENYTQSKLLFLWPAEGRIAAYFDERVNNKVNKGIEIQTAKYANVKSSFKGKITFSDDLKGYGNTIIIKHPQGLSTVYANLSDIFVKKDDYVQSGEILGKTSKDLRKGIFLLHFEVRDGYKAKNPLIYLNRE